MNRIIQVLVTGADGQVGKELKKLALPGYSFVNKKDLDITDSEALERYLGLSQIKYIVNCAAYTAVDKAEENREICFKVNVTAVKYLATLCSKMGIHLIHLSSDYVYNPVHNMPISEEHNCQPQGIYALSKWEGEKAALAANSNVTIIRTSWVYSSYGHNFVKTMMRLGQERDHLKIVDDQIGSPTFAGDLAESIANIIGRANIEGGIFNYSNLGYISWADFAQAIFDHLNIEVQIERIPSVNYPTPAPRPSNSRLIKSKIAETFGLELKHWHKSLVKCLKEIDN